VFGGKTMQPETESLDDFEEKMFENEDENFSHGEKQATRARGPRLVKSKINNNVAAWRKIEDYWENYNLKKQINDDLYQDENTDHLPDGESN
jgi:hypothetical protein